MPTDGRWAINLKNGSSESKVYNNILIHENSARGGIEIDTSSLTGFFSNYNILGQISVDETSISLSMWQSTYSQDAQSFSQTAPQTFVAPGSNYHLLNTTLAKDGGTALSEVTTDLDGTSRPQGVAYDIGAYEYPTVACPACSGDTVVLTNESFAPDSNCECVGTISITIGTDVTVQTGATVIFKAPMVHVSPGFHAENGLCGLCDESVDKKILKVGNLRRGMADGT